MCDFSDKLAEMCAKLEQYQGKVTQLHYYSNMLLLLSLFERQLHILNMLSSIFFI